MLSRCKLCVPTYSSSPVLFKILTSPLKKQTAKVLAFSFKIPYKGLITEIHSSCGKLFLSFGFSIAKEYQTSIVFSRSSDFSSNKLKMVSSKRDLLVDRSVDERVIDQKLEVIFRFCSSFLLPSVLHQLDHNLHDTLRMIYLTCVSSELVLWALILISKSSIWYCSGRLVLKMTLTSFCSSALELLSTSI